MDFKLGIYRHFKGGFYKVLHIATHSETQEKLVVYQPMYGERDIWVRPFDMFTESIERDGKTMLRFQFYHETDYE